MLVEEGVDKFKGDYIDTPIRNLHLDCFTCGFTFSFHNDTLKLKNHSAHFGFGFSWKDRKNLFREKPSLR